MTCMPCKQSSLCLGNSGEGKFLNTFRCKHFWCVVGWIPGCGAYGYGGLALQVNPVGNVRKTMKTSSGSEKYTASSVPEFHTPVQEAAFLLGWSPAFNFLHLTHSLFYCLPFPAELTLQGSRQLALFTALQMKPQSVCAEQIPWHVSVPVGNKSLLIVHFT